MRLGEVLFTGLSSFSNEKLPQWITIAGEVDSMKAQVLSILFL